MVHLFVADAEVRLDLDQGRLASNPDLLSDFGCPSL
jgi:hypothetical protein